MIKISPFLLQPRHSTIQLRPFYSAVARMEPPSRLILLLVAHVRSRELQVASRTAQAEWLNLPDEGDGMFRDRVIDANE